MQGHGYTPPVKQPPATGWLVVLRMLLIVVSFCSLGFLAWTMLLRLAIVTRKSLDWGLFVAVMAADVLSLVLLGSESGDEIHTTGGWLGLFLLLGTLVATTAYFLTAEIRHYQQLSRAAYGAGGTTGTYGYPQPPAPYPATTMHHTPIPAVPQPPLRTPPPPVQAPQPPLSTTPPPPQRPAPARIDQVRAELDELSDYLRKHDGHHDDHQQGDHEGGR
ncbi:hypothetical protein [Streptomyces sp. NPDC047000]|uniref:hypothetical protein n=1 Tax=Streptomyces sp. NPDC047000 TaxID=3155474 RepID=UPI0033DAA3F6